jgi:ATP-dependent Lon protease
MRGASGQQNANFGIKSEAASGVGIQRLKQQGEIATFHFPDNLARGLRYEAKVLIDLIQKIYDTKRVVRILGLDGKQEQAVLDPSQQQPYNESDIGEADIQKVFNPQIGQYDVVIDTGASFQTQRQEGYASMMELAARNPQVMGIAGDLILGNADFPGADQLAERFAKTLPPNLQEQKGGAEQQLAQLSGQMQQAQQQMQMMAQQLQEAQMKLQQAESGQAKVQMEIQAKMQLAQVDAQIAAEMQRNDLEMKQQALLIEQQFKREQAELQAHLDTERTRKEIAASLEKAKMEIESKEEIAELNAYVEMQKIGKENAGLTAEVNGEFFEGKEE